LWYFLPRNCILNFEKRIKRGFKTYLSIKKIKFINLTTSYSEWGNKIIRIVSKIKFYKSFILLCQSLIPGWQLLIWTIQPSLWIYKTSILINPFANLKIVQLNFHKNWSWCRSQQKILRRWKVKKVQEAWIAPNQIQQHIAVLWSPQTKNLNQT